MIHLSNNAVYRLSQPKDTHMRRATCEEAQCPHYLLGWQTPIDEATGFGQGQARYIRFESGREFKEERNAVGLTVFTFHPGQTCFGRKHYTTLDRDAIFEKLRPGREPVWMFGQDWIDDSGEMFYQIGHLRAQG